MRAERSTAFRLSSWLERLRSIGLSRLSFDGDAIEGGIFAVTAVLAAAAALVLAIHPAPADYDAMLPLYGLGGIGVLVALASSLRGCLPSGIVLGLAMVVPLLLLGHLAGVVVVALQWAVVFTVGYCFLGRLQGAPFQFAMLMVAGYTAYSLATTVLVYANTFQAPLLIALHLACLLGLAAHASRTDWSLTVPRYRSAPHDVRWPDLAAIALAVMIIVIFGILAGIPEQGSDPVAAYRPMVAEILHSGRHNIDPNETTIGLLSIPSIWSQALSVVLAQDFSAGKLWNYSTFCGAFLLSFHLARIVGGLNGEERGSDRTGAPLLATVLVFSVPTMAKLNLSALPDMGAVVCVLLLVFWTWCIAEKTEFENTSQVRLAIASGSLVALAFLTKFLLAPVIMIHGGLIAAYLVLSKRNRHTVAFLFWTLISSGVIVFVWFVFVYVHTGNPTFPYYNGFWQSPFIDPFVSPHGGYFSVTLPWDMTVATMAYSVAGAVDGSFGLTFLVGSLICIGLLVRRVCGRTVSPITVICAVSFLVSLYGISILQNGDRYIVPVLALLVLPIMEILTGVGRRRWSVLLATVCVFNIAMLPRFGFGSGAASIEQAYRSTFPEVYRDQLDRQRVTDRLSSLYGDHGRTLDLTGSITPLGTTLAPVWYHSISVREIGPYLGRGPEGLEALLREKNIDAVTVDTNVVTNTSMMSMADGIATLRRLSKTVDQEGSYIIFHMRDDVRFDEFIPVARAAGSDLLDWEIGKGTYAWDIRYSCRTPGTIARIRVFGGTWAERYSLFPLCDGGYAEMSSPLISTADHERSYFIFSGFGPDLKITKSGVWHRID